MLVRTAAAGALVLAAAVFGCGGGSAVEPRDARAGGARRMTRIAVLPAVWVAGGTGLSVDARGALTRGLEAEGGVTVRNAEVETSGGQDAASCAEDLSCVRRVGAGARAAKALVTRLAELGDTVVVRVALVDVGGGTQETARQEVVREATAARLDAALERVAREIARPFVPPRPPEEDAWYERWEVWAVTGVVVTAASVAAALLLTADPETQPDAIVTGLHP